ncbi:uncharacterized protein EAE97_001945 [Botrytis byssoidea]|uniref:Uncharacterized protein n=1 Tax=Botrytis byssoidea TaxID=139641 RepID=A0A9P5IST8_9HELO|nr:uncharacterized protein EAE97_001945 [Botrytis byssoidea]KAF7952448.1 hypothetical protein EAE97_001945 [Botrytis byssoidea]
MHCMSIASRSTIELFNSCDHTYLPSSPGQSLTTSYRGHSQDFVTTSTPVYSPGHIGYLPDNDQYRVLGPRVQDF